MQLTRFAPCQALLVILAKSRSLSRAASATLVSQAWWWPCTSKTSKTGCVSQHNCIAGFVAQLQSLLSSDNVLQIGKGVLKRIWQLHSSIRPFWFLGMTPPPQENTT